MSPVGMSQPPIRSRQAPPYRILEDWVRLTLVNNPQLREHPTPAQALAPAVEARLSAPAGRADSQWGADGPAGSKGAEPAAAALKPPAEPGAEPTPPTAAPTPAPPVATPRSEAPAAEPVDPFDPEVFNRQMHPDKDKP